MLAVASKDVDIIHLAPAGYVFSLAQEQIPLLRIKCYYCTVCVGRMLMAVQSLMFDIQHILITRVLRYGEWTGM